MVEGLLLACLVFNGSFLHYVASLSVPRPIIHEIRASSLSAFSGADIEQEAGEKQPPQVVGDKIIYRGKVNEVDYCIAPGDISLSCASGKISTGDDDKSPQTISLTQALNNASNRAVRRILLAKSWPSEEAFNRSLRLAAAAEKKAQLARDANGKQNAGKCPIPRPILKMITRRDSSTTSSPSKKVVNGVAPSTNPSKKTRTNEQYVADQISAFQERYGTIPDYKYAEAYLESVLSLATTGEESPRVKEVRKLSTCDFYFYKVMLSNGHATKISKNISFLVIGVRIKGIPSKL